MMGFHVFKDPIDLEPVKQAVVFAAIHSHELMFCNGKSKGL